MTDSTITPQITGPQHRKLHALFREAGVCDRGERLAITSHIIGRRVATSLDLTLDEASTVIDSLKSWGMPSRRDMRHVIASNVTENFGKERISWL